MAQGAGRVVCPRCGANNFDTVTVCWKCSAPLGAPQAPPAAQSVPSQRSGVQGLQSGSSPYQPDVMAMRAVNAAGLAGNPNAANRAAMWLGLLMPYFGLPIGLAFLMCDDARRQEVGRICLLWSLISSVIHVVLAVVAALGMREYIQFALQAAMGAAKRSGGGGGGGFDVN